jgi:siroheme synthase
MPKLNIIPERDNANAMQYDALLCPVVLRVCHCEQCRYVKNKRKNRKLKKKIKRLMNKKARQSKLDGRCYTHYWA